METLIVRTKKPNKTKLVVGLILGIIRYLIFPNLIFYYFFGNNLVNTIDLWLLISSMVFIFFTTCFLLLRYKVKKLALVWVGVFLGLISCVYWVMSQNFIDSLLLAFGLTLPAISFIFFIPIKIKDEKRWNWIEVICLDVRD